MKILHINTHDVAGGAAKVAARLMDEQIRAGHEVRLLAGHKLGTSERAAGIDLSRDAVFEKLFNALGLLYYEYQGSHDLHKHPWVVESDIIHLHNLHGGYINPFSLLFLTRAKPVVWTLHDMQSFTGYCAHSFECNKWKTGCGNCPTLDIYPGISFDATSQLMHDKNSIYQNSEMVITSPSKWLKDKVAESVLGHFRCDLINNGIDTNIFKPGDKKLLRQKYNIPQEAFIIGGVAHEGVLSNSWKGGKYTHDVLEKVFREIPNAVFLNIGSNKQSGIDRIVDIPAIAEESLLAEIYSLTDVYLTTSIADNAPLTVIEALASGLPVVSFNTGGIPEMVADGVNGYICEYKNAGLAADALISLAANPEVISQFGINARRDALERYDQKVISQQFVSLYEEIREGFAPNAKSLKLSLFPKEIQTEKFKKNLQEFAGESGTFENPLAAADNNNSSKPSEFNILKHTSVLPIISIVTPSFNQADYLEECIESILGQNYPYLEYIILDGGSTDGSVDIIKKYEKYLTYWRSGKDAGQYAAIHEGLSMTNGSIMTWLNSDDKYHPFAFFKVAEAFNSAPEVLWLSGRTSVWNKTGNLDSMHPHPAQFSLNRFLSYEFDNPFIQQESVFWRRELWNRSGAFVDSRFNYAGDLDLWMRFFRITSIHVLDVFTGGYRKHGNQKAALEYAKYKAEAEIIINREREYYVRNQDNYQRRSHENNSLKVFMQRPLFSMENVVSITRDSKAWKFYLDDLLRHYDNKSIPNSSIPVFLERQFVSFTEFYAERENSANG